MGQLSNGDGAVAGCAGGIGKILAYLGCIDVEGCNELNIANVVVAKLCMHEAGNFFIDRGVAVVLHALDKGSGAIANANDGNLYL